MFLKNHSFIPSFPIISKEPNKNSLNNLIPPEIFLLPSSFHPLILFPAFCVIFPTLDSMLVVFIFSVPSIVIHASKCILIFHCHYLLFNYFS